ncbi:MAG: hypothetical protein R6V21_10555 [Pelovirga sp.]
MEKIEIGGSFDVQGNLVDSKAQEQIRELPAAFGDWHSRVRS